MNARPLFHGVPPDGGHLFQRRAPLNGIRFTKSRRIGEVIKRSEVVCLLHGFLKRENLSLFGSCCLEHSARGKDNQGRRDGSKIILDA